MAPIQRRVKGFPSLVEKRHVHKILMVKSHHLIVILNTYNNIYIPEHLPFDRRI